MAMRRWMTAALGACVLATPVRAGAQDLSRPDTAAQRSARLFTRRDLYIAGGFAAGAAAMFPLDRTLARHLQDSTVQANKFLSHTATAARVLGSPGALIIPAATYVGGLAFRSPKVESLGLHTFESVALAGMITRVAKVVAGRARPFVDPGNPFDYKVGRGFGKDRYSSMPSGHATAAFAAASAATSEVGAWWPQHRVVTGVVLYSLAGMTGLSRMYNNAHWASDVVVGAAVGCFSGWKVVGYTHAHPNNPIDRVLLRTRIAPTTSGGMAIVWSAATH